MGGRFGPSRELEVGAGFRVASKLTTKHRYAYYDRDRSRLVITRIDGSDTVSVPSRNDEIGWAPDGRSLFTGGDQVRRVDAATAECTTLVRLPPKRHANSLDGSPDGKTLAFTITTVEREASRAESGLYIPAVKSEALAILDLETGELIERHDNPATFGINVCWATRRAAILLRTPIPKQSVSIVNIDSGESIETVPFRPWWRERAGRSRCDAKFCSWHLRATLPKAERDEISLSQLAPAHALHGSNVAYILKGAELRLAERGALRQNRLVMRTRGRQFPIEQRMSIRANIHWSPDGGLLFGTIAKWTRKSKLSRQDKEAISEDLRRIELTAGPRSPEELSPIIAEVTERRRFSARTYHFVIDVKEGVIVFESGCDWLDFSPHPFR